jgi:hypothetical protein
MSNKTMIATWNATRIATDDATRNVTRDAIWDSMMNKLSHVE